MDINVSIVTQTLAVPIAIENKIQLDMLRLDTLHPHVSGNKWFKLKEQIKAFNKNDYKAILTFGGAYSNHLSAAAAACNYYNIPCLGIVRGAELSHNSNATLQFCIDQGMQLHFISREKYKEKDSASFHTDLKQKFGNVFIIPEGGNNILGRLGVASIYSYIQLNYDYIVLSVGSGTTLLGLSDSVDPTTKIVGYIPMKAGGNYANQYVTKNTNWQLIDAYHFGGFGKYNDTLVQFIKSFYQSYNIPLDIIYTGKMMYGLLNDIGLGKYPSNAKILCIHTGGLQGNASVSDKLGF